MSASKFPSSISSPNLAKQDSGSSSTSSSRHHHDLINFNEDYGRVVEERERRLEERRMSGSRGSSGSSGNGELRTPKSKKRTLQLPNAPNREIKPSTILRLEDRDLVVIDKHDIKEAVKNESQVIIVDPPALPATPSENEHVDLGDILGNEWPELAGSMATVLNTDKKSGSTSGSVTNGWKTTERNKSLNIASHLSSSKPRRYENGIDKKSKCDCGKRDCGENNATRLGCRCPRLAFSVYTRIFSQLDSFSPPNWLTGKKKLFLARRRSEKSFSIFFSPLRSVVPLTHCTSESIGLFFCSFKI